MCVCVCVCVQRKLLMEGLYASHPSLEIIPLIAAIYVATCGRMTMSNDLARILQGSLLTVLR